MKDPTRIPTKWMRAHEWVRQLTGFWFNFGLGTRMAVIVLFGTFALVSLFAYLGTAALGENIQRSLQERLVLAQTTARHMDYVLANIENALTDSANLPVWSDPARHPTSIRNAHRRLSFFATQSFLIDPRGSVIAAYPPITTSLSLDHFASIAAVLNGEPFAVSRYRRALGALDASTVAAAPVRDGNGALAGALVISIDLTGPNILVFRQTSGLGETGYMDLVDLGGAILASTRAERIGQASDHGETLAGMIHTRRTDVSTCHNCHTPLANPESEILAFTPLDRSEWGVAVRQSEAEVFAATRSLQTRIFVLMLIMLAGALVLVYLTTQSVLAPVQALTAAAQRIAGGDLQTAIHARGRDEISTLAHAFDAMRARLQVSISEIQEWNRQLEARVHERTETCTIALNENQQLYAELQRHDQVRGELLHRLISAQEDERKRIARELHDETSQILTGLAYAVDSVAETPNPEEVACGLEKMRQMTETALESVQRIIFDLRPAMLDHLGLMPALRWYAESRFDDSVTWKIREAGQVVRLPTAIETALFRVVQEAINNIARHSHARHAELDLEFFAQRVQVFIRDDGVGFEPVSVAGAPDGKRGLGLMGMAERMTVIGGEFYLRSSPGKGTEIRLIIPLKERDNGRE